MAEPELRRRSEVDLRAESGGQQLCTEADAEVRDSGVDGLADQALLPDEPGIRVLFVDARGTSQRKDQVVGSPVRKPVDLAREYAVDIDRTLSEYLAVDDERVRPPVFEDECPQRPARCCFVYRRHGTVQSLRLAGNLTGRGRRRIRVSVSDNGTAPACNAAIPRVSLRRR